jgi:hypothetical protein
VQHRRPDLFIVGAPKCGTTSIYEYLRRHPEVFMSPTKEPRYFSPDVQGGVSRDGLRHGLDLERYLGLFSGAQSEKRLGEATTRYLYSRQAPGLVRQFQPDAFIVASLRNPVDMMQSLHAHHLASGAEDITDFAEALDAEDDRRRGRRVPPGTNGELLRYRDWARFGEQLARWLEAFGPQRVQVLLLEELTADPRSSYRRLLEFLEVDPAFVPASFAAHNVASEARSPALRMLLNSRAPRRLMAAVLPEKVRTRTTRRIGAGLRKFNRRPIRRSDISPELRRQLEADMSADVALTGRLIGRDLLSFWFGVSTPSGDSQGLPEHV